jgi:hypothetical protein
MSPSIFTRAALAAGLLASSASAAFNAASKTNVVMYWGQGSDQVPLSDVCADPNIDIVSIGCKYFRLHFGRAEAALVHLGTTRTTSTNREQFYFSMKHTTEIIPGRNKRMSRILC